MKFRSSQFVLAAVMVVSGAMTSTANAALIAYDGFDYPTGNLAGNGTGSLGFSSNWSTPTDAVTVTSPGLTFPELAVNGNTAFLSPSSANAASERMLSSSLATEGGAPTYISFLFDRQAGSRYFGLELRDGGSQTVFVGSNSGASNYTLSGPVSLDSGVPVTADPALLVVRIDSPTGGSNDSISLFVNPTPGGPEPTADATATGLNVDSFDLISLAAGFTSGSNTTATGFIDEIRIGSTFASVTPAAVPEPSTLALLLISAATLQGPLARRRRAVAHRQK